MNLEELKLQLILRQKSLDDFPVDRTALHASLAAPYDIFTQTYMLKKIKLFLTFLCWLSVLLMWSSAATVYVSPAVYGGYFGVVGLLFPVFVAFVLLMLAVCAVTKQRAAWICVFGLLACCGSLRDYCPINLTSPPPQRCLKVMTYNTMTFGLNEKDGSDYVVPRYIVTSQPDIVAMQETTVEKQETLDDIERYFRRSGYHFEQYPSTFCRVAVASKFPITHSEKVCSSASNGVAAFTVRPSSRDSIIVISAHLHSMGLTSDERNNFHEMVVKPEEVDNIRGKRGIVRKLAKAARERAAMVDTVAQYIDRHKGVPIILMGDFNDTPISYAHHTVCSRLTDAYRATANGIGRSFNQDAIYVRIDNIFCSDHWKPFACEVDNTVNFSDHYPVTAYLKRQ